MQFFGKCAIFWRVCNFFTGVQRCRAAARCLPRCLRCTWGLLINHHHQRHHIDHRIKLNFIIMIIRWAGRWTRVRLGETPRPCGRTYHISLPRSSASSSPSTKEGTLGRHKNCLMLHHDINRDIYMWIVLDSVWGKQRHNLWIMKSHTHTIFLLPFFKNIQQWNTIVLNRVRNWFEQAN